MLKYKQAFKKKENIIQLLKFSAVGISNTIIGLAIYYLLLFFNVNYLLSNLISWIISVFNAFYWNNNYVFKNNNRWVGVLIKTYISYAASFLFSMILLFILVEVLRVSSYIAPLLVLIITIPLNFLLNKFWTFK